MSHKLEIDSPRLGARQAMRVIRPQFPDSPEGRLFCAIFNQVLADLFDKNERNGALHYLNGKMWHCEMCGVNPVWVRETLTKYGVSLESPMPIPILRRSNKLPRIHKHPFMAQNKP